MKYWLKSEIQDKIQADLDLEDETFITDAEMLGYMNEAIDEAEAEIQSEYEDYFLARTTVTLVSGTEGYALPTTIYANKIRRVIYRNGSIIYTIPRLKDSSKFETYTQGLVNLPSGDAARYSYFLENSVAGAPTIVFTPLPQESGAYITIWHYRNANRLVNDSDVCDIPEFVSFVIQFVKVRCYEKENHPSLPLAVQALQAQRVLMNSTLSTMVPDADNLIELDTTHYVEHN